MKVQKVRHYKPPHYPDKSEAMRDPSLLRTVPARWKGNLCAGAALTTLIMLTFTACGQKGGSGQVNTVSVGQPRTTDREKQGVVAPIFPHGEGRGSFGCVSVAPPSFLSEEEAFQVISEEAAKMGVTFEKNGMELENIEIPETKFYLKRENEADEVRDSLVIDSTRPGTLELDGYDANHKLGFEFISEEDYQNWQVDQSIRSSVDDYDFISTANMLNKGLDGKTGTTNVGVFYNVMTQPDPEEIKGAGEEGGWQRLEPKVKETAKEELRSQVKDFLEWMKAQGIL